MARLLQRSVLGLLSLVWLCTTIFLSSVPIPLNVDVIDNMKLSDTSRTLQQGKIPRDKNGMDKSKDTNAGMTFVQNHNINLTGIYFPASDEDGKPGYVHDATTLHNNPPTFDAKGVQCGTNDAIMQLLTQFVYVDLAAHERANNLGKPRAKIFCHIYTTKQKHIQIQTIRETWGHRCDGFLVASTTTERSIDAVSMPHEGKEEYGNMWQKVRAMWTYVYVNYFDSYDWFHIGGDDMYVLVENLRLYLESEEIVAASNGGEKPLLLGQQFYLHGNRTSSYVTGGGGYTLNKVALQALVASFPNCAQHAVSSAEDFLVTQCLRKEGITAYNTTDDAGAERYNHENPEFEFNFDPNKNPLFWYTYFSDNKNVGPERVVKRSVSFHLKRGDMDGKPRIVDVMRRVHAILYGHCANVTLGPPVPTKRWSDGKILWQYWKKPSLECKLKAKADEICVCSMVKKKKTEVEVCKTKKRPNKLH